MFLLLLFVVKMSNVSINKEYDTYEAIEDFKTVEINRFGMIY
jgi:hypothetical protein